MSDEERKTVQDRLDELCDQHRMKSFDVKHYSHKSKKWKALVLRMCGLEVTDPTPGRNPDKDLELAGGLAYLYFDLCGYKPEDLVDEIIKEYNLKPNKSGHVSQSDLRETVRTARKKYKKEIEKLALKTKHNKENPDIKLIEELQRMME